MTSVLIAYVSDELFSKYVGNREEVFVLRLGQARPYASPLPLSQLSGLISANLTAPQSYCTSAGSEAWSKALMATALLHRDWSYSQTHIEPDVTSHSEAPGAPKHDTVMSGQYALEL